MHRRMHRIVSLIAPTVFGAIFGLGWSARAITPSDTFFDSQWYLQKISAPQAWDTAQGDPSAVVAVIDTGVDTDHPDLAGNIWRNLAESLDGLDNDGNGYRDDLMGWNFIDDVGDPKPRLVDFTRGAANHGTLIAGEVAAIGGNSTGIAGVSWRSRIMALRALNSRGEGNTGTVVQAIDYAIQNGADIIGLSFVGPDFSSGLNDAIRRAYDAGILVVAAAGNSLTNGQAVDLDTSPNYPVCSDGGDGTNRVIGVASVNRSDRRSSFSGYGRSCIDISAPGEDIFSTEVVESSAGFNDEYGGGWNGSSLAVPLVTGTAALIKSFLPNFTVAQLRDAILNSTDPIDSLNPGFEGRIGKGRLNVERALSSAIAANVGVAPAPTPAPTPAPSTTTPVPQPLAAPAPLPEAFIATATGPGVSSDVRMFTRSGAFVRSFAPYASGFRGGFSLAAGDLDADGDAEIVSVPGPGGGPHVRVWNLDGALAGQFFAFDAAEATGLSVAVGDVVGDGAKEIIVSRLSGEPVVRIFDRRGTKLAEWYAYDPRFRGGVRVSAGDFSGDGKAEIVVVPGPGGGPHVRIMTNLGATYSEYLTGTPTDLSGLEAAVGDLDGDGKREVTVRSLGSLALGSTALRGFNRDGALVHEIEIEQVPGPAPFSAGDLDGNRKGEIILGTPAGGDPGVRAVTREGVLVSFVQPYTTISTSVTGIVVLP